MLDSILSLKEILLEGLGSTLYMVIGSTLLAYVIGLPLGVLLYTTAKGGIHENLPLNRVLGWVVNIGRSIPFIILIIALIPFTRLVAGKAIGPTAAIVPLVVGSAPFVARLVEQSLQEVDTGVIEAAECMGATRFQIILQVLLGESLPSLIRGLSITAITLIGYSAMAGTVGAGGLGDIAIRYGYYRYQTEVMLFTILLLVILVCLIQFLFGFTANRIDKRNRS
ncbi:MAG TPA: ABC transporter permease [Candidatus Pygmaiobacter gallistercoris]|nr:ABC transporter permease [Candidatus Pygmaiobacter gallistercoris]